MSVQFGKCNFDGMPVDAGDLDKVRHLLAPYGPDGEACICKDNLAILFLAFHTTKESRREIQPHVSQSGALLTWDGRLDNREELIRLLGGGVSITSTDLEIVAAAYEHWGIDSLAKLIGDWALSIWDVKNRCLILAKDFVGARQLYYSVKKGGQITWCTILDPLVLFADHSFKLEEEYIAGWLSCFPAPHLTPYVGIHAVPPSSIVRLTRGARTIHKYWGFDRGKRIRYQADVEYEEQFRSIFSEAVRRRLRSDGPVLAELSGGMDSSSIVCVADHMIGKGQAESVRLDTVSYYDDSEPNWNERPYFTRVEEKRGRAGCHIDAGFQNASNFNADLAQFSACPSSQTLTPAVRRALSECMLNGRNRVLLSGIGGDEFLGGVPTPIPELSDLAVNWQLRTMARQLKCWALEKRKPWFHLVLEVGRRFLPITGVGLQDHLRAYLWLDGGFACRQRRTLRGYDSRLKLVGGLPSFQENIFAIDSLRRQLSCEPQRSDPPYEIRYPLLDRDLLEFVLAIPRSQLVRPGERRSLMRRALTDIVPAEILHRKRKAYVARAGLALVEGLRQTLINSHIEMLSTSFGIVNKAQLTATCLNAPSELPPISLMRLISLEAWLRCAKPYLIQMPMEDSRPGDMEESSQSETKKGLFTDFSWPANESKKGGNDHEVRETANL